MPKVNGICEDDKCNVEVVDMETFNDHKHDDRYYLKWEVDGKTPLTRHVTDSQQNGKLRFYQYGKVLMVSFYTKSLEYGVRTGEQWDPTFIIPSDYQFLGNSAIPYYCMLNENVCGQVKLNGKYLEIGYTRNVKTGNPINLQTGDFVCFTCVFVLE